MARRFRFGVQVSQAESYVDWRDKARKIEDLGYSTLYMPDHFGQELAPLPAIAMAAAHTTTLRIGALVFDNDYKHPAILAKEAATIDLLSDGRLELGIGAGWLKTDYDALGLPGGTPAWVALPAATMPPSGPVTAISSTSTTMPAISSAIFWSRAMAASSVLAWRSHSAPKRRASCARCAWTARRIPSRPLSLMSHCSGRSSRLPSSQGT